MTTHAIPNKVTDETALERLLASPRPELVTDLRSWSGDLVVLGAGGKMGPSLAKLARAGLDAAGRTGDVVHAVSRFPEDSLRRDLTVDWVGIRLDDGASSTVTLNDPFCAADERIDALLESMEHSTTDLPTGV